MTIKLTHMRVVDLMDQWRPGSQGDSWTWEDEHLYCFIAFQAHTNVILSLVKTQGIDFDDKDNPITLGSDGRVWDGHHRILIARYLKIEFVNVDIIQPPI